MKDLRLLPEERMILSRLSIDQLQFFIDLSQHKYFSTFQKIISDLIDAEKNIFYTEKEYDPQKLAIDHAFSRGGVAKLMTVLRIIASSSHELSTRKKE